MSTTRRRRVTALVFVLALLVSWTVPPAAHAAATSVPSAQEPEAQAPQDPDEHAVVQEGGELTGVDAHAEEGEPKPWFYWPAKWFNFLALCGFLYWMLVVPPAAIQDIFSFPGLRVILAERGAGIIAARDLAAQQSEEATQMLSDSEQRLSKIEEEVGALASDARRDAERERERALEDGKLQAEKIIQVADREVQNEGITANRQLRAFVADLAVNMAERSLSEHLTADDQDRLIRDYLSRLGKSMA